MGKVRIVIVLSIFFLILCVSAVKAACSPAECGLGGMLSCPQQGWPAGSYCAAYCCVPPATPAPPECTQNNQCASTNCCKGGSCVNSSQCATPAPCTVTAPTIGTITTNLATTAIINWTSGTGGTSHRLYVSDVQANVLNNCPPGVCAYQNTTATSPTTVTGLTAGKVYYYRVVNYSSSTCFAADLESRLSSCSISATSPINGGSTSNAISNITSTGLSVNFSISNPAILKNGISHPLYAYGRNIYGGERSKVVDSPKA